MEIHGRQEALDRLAELKQDIACANKRKEPPITNGIAQAEIVWDAYHHQKFYGSVSDLAEYLGVSKPKVSNCLKIMRGMIPEVKEWFRATDYQVYSLYHVASMSELAQWEFLRQQKLLSELTVTDVLRIMDAKPNSSTSTKTKEEV